MKRVLVGVALLLLGACGNDGDDASLAETTTTAPAPSSTTTSTEPPFSTTPVSNIGSTPATLTAVDVGRHDGFTRVVFRFADHVPGYEVKTAEPPFFTDGEGKEVQVDGTGFLSVRLNANAHDDDGKSTLQSARRITGPPGGQVTEAVMLGDFEALVTWIVGTNDVRPFKVYELSGPARLVIDVQS